jgi:tetratricopeptide (TPR) repeat protein
MVSSAFSRDQVLQTVHVHEGDLSGTPLSNVLITGEDAEGNGFEGMTDSNGVALAYGQPGTWRFVFAKEGYETLDLSYDVIETGEGAVYLIRSDLPSEQNAPSQNNQQLDKISESTISYLTQMELNATPFAVPKIYQEREKSYQEKERYYQEKERPKPTVSEMIETNEPETAYEEFWLGNILYSQGKYEEAVKAYDEAIRLNPQFAMAWNNKGVALMSLGRTAEANAVVAKAKEMGISG